MGAKHKYNSLAEKFAAHRERRLRRMAYTAARLVVQDDMSRGVNGNVAWSEISNYETELLPLVRELDAQGIGHIYIPHKAMRKYIADCYGEKAHHGS